MTTTDEKKRYTSASNSRLPLASVIPDTEMMKRAVALLNEDMQLKTSISAMEERTDEIKDELAAICQAYDLKGFRHGLNGFEYHGYATRKTLSKEKLLALGVSAETIDRATVDGQPYLFVRVVRFDIE